MPPGFLAWKVRPLGLQRRGCPHSGPDRKAFQPFYVRSQRLDGNPRQEILATFPTIRSCCLATPEARIMWWQAVQPVLREIEFNSGIGIDYGTSIRIEEELKKAVLPPTEDEQRAYLSGRIRAVMGFA